MFPRLRQRLGTNLLDRIDLALEFSTLGAYGLAEDGRPLALDQGVFDASVFDAAAELDAESCASTFARGRDRCELRPTSSAWDRNPARDRSGPRDRCNGEARA